VSGGAQFTGDIPTFYDRCLGPVLFEPYAADLVGRLPPGDELRVLEIACGTGIVTRRVRRALPGSASLVATDLNEAMVSYAQAAVLEPGIAWEVADAQALRFADASFDVVVCQFGFMFLPHRAQGFREARRVLVPGGLLLGNVWRSMDENRYVLAVHTRLATLFPDDPPRFLEPYGDRDADLRADMSAAGWEDMRFDDVRLQGSGPSATEFATGFVRGSPLSHALLERNADLDAVVAELSEDLASVGGERPPAASGMVIHPSSTTRFPERATVPVPGGPPRARVLPHTACATLRRAPRTPDG
jgi:SAM-dependent methyltransferase